MNPSLLLRLASRSLRRNRRRSLITILGIAFGLALMSLSNNISYGSHQDMIRSAVGLMAGHVVVQHRAWQEDPSAAHFVPDSGRIVARLQQAIPEASVLRRIQMEGLLLSPRSTSAVGLRAVEPEAEAAVIDLDDRIVEGAWLQSGDLDGVVLGTVLAERLSVGLGDKVVFMSQVAGQEVESRLFRVRGLFRTGSPEIDGLVAIVPLPAAQPLLPGPDAATMIALHLPDDRQTAAMAARARAAVDDPTLAVLGWPEAIPDIVAFVELDSAWSDAMWAVLGLIVALGVVNTVLMSVMERVREFGIMLAVGMRPRQLATMVLAEGVGLGLLGALLGLLLGTLLTLPLMHWGLDLSEMYGGESIEAGGVPLSLVLYPRLDLARMGTYPLVGIGFALLASLYPAWKVTSLRPIDAIRHE